MKKVLLFVFLFCSLGTFAQKSDTLNIPVGKYQFIKIGDKVYRLDINLIEVKEEKVFSGIMVDSIGVNTSHPTYLPNYFYRWQSSTNPGDILKSY